MPTNYNGTSLTHIKYNGTDCGKVTYNGTLVFVRVDSASGYWVSNQGSSNTYFQYGMTKPSTSAQQTGVRVTCRSDRYANNPNDGTYYSDVSSGSGQQIRGTSGLKYIRVQNYYDYNGNRYYGTYQDTTYQYTSSGCSCNNNCGDCDNSSCSCNSKCSGNCSNCPHGCANCSNSGGPVGSASC